MESSLWYLQQQSRCLQDYRLDIRGIWADDAATEINRRYLDIHAQDSSQSTDNLSSQLASISTADLEFELASQAGATATELSHQIDRLLQSAHMDIDRSQIEYNMYQTAHLTAAAEIVNIERLIAQAGEYPS